MLELEKKSFFKIDCSHLILATGGAGKSFLYTSNWEGATGDGLKIAHDLGAKLNNLEMVQFHPTCLFHTKARNFLISEALRGEGAKLIDENGKPFAHKFHEDGELAPRDVVSRAIEYNIKSQGKDCVYLDITHLDSTYLKKRFPNIYSKCESLGFNLAQQAVPVVPAAHYTCGGIRTKKDLVSTDVDNLFAVGECGHTGLHGANRLASNSLLECLATASFCAETIAKQKTNGLFQSSSFPITSKPDPKDLGRNKSLGTLDPFLVNAVWEEVRNLMWNYVGIQRSKQRLDFALEKIERIESLIADWNFQQMNRDATELSNIVFFSKYCILSALERTESRGCHFLEDHPGLGTDLFTTQVSRGKVSKTPL